MFNSRRDTNVFVTAFIHKESVFVLLQPKNLTVSMTVVCAENLIHID